MRDRPEKKGCEKKDERMKQAPALTKKNPKRRLPRLTNKGGGKASGPPQTQRSKLNKNNGRGKTWKDICWDTWRVDKKGRRQWKYSLNSRNPPNHGFSRGGLKKKKGHDVPNRKKTRGYRSKKPGQKIRWNLCYKTRAAVTSVTRF